MMDQKETVGLVVIGMAGSGKSTFVGSFANYLKNVTKNMPLIVNLDPAVLEVNYRPNIDIRKSIDYIKLMEQYNLGPNGAIMTGLNLYATSFNQVINFIKNRKSSTKYVIFDTPGQIEVFNWSASGSVITQLLSSFFPTIIIYVADTTKCLNPTTFMANMTYSCSILYKYQLPFILAFNKTDQTDPKFAFEWMKDCDAYGKALDSVEGYISNLNWSLSLVLDDFYENISCVALSAKTSHGFDNMLEEISKGIKDYQEKIAPNLCKIQYKPKNELPDEKNLKNISKNDENGFIKSVPAYSMIEFQDFDEESEGEEDLDLPQYSRILDEKEIEEKVKSFKI